MLLTVLLIVFGRSGPALAQAVLFQTGFSRTQAAQAYTAVSPDCDQIRVESLDEIDFSTTELRLICGDPRTDSIGAVWSRIPPNQAAYFLRGFFQARGYHRPTFVQDGGKLFASPGPLSHLEDLSFSNAPRNWEAPQRRLIRGRPLTPSLLNEVQDWSLAQVKNEGYACARASSRADPLSGEVRVTFDLEGGPRLISGVRDINDTGLRPGVLGRYDAFKVGTLYRDRRIRLTERRMREEGFLQTLSLTPKCEAGGVVIERRVALGPPRLISFGVGGSSDEGARVRAILRQNRIGASASSAQMRVNLTYLNELVHRQTADSSYRWFYSAEEPRSFIEPSISFEHAAKPQIESQSFQGRVMHGWNHELLNAQFEIKLGPTFLDSKLFRGQGPNNVSATYAELGGRYTEHDFEYFATSPRTGGTVQGTFLATFQDWGAQFTAQKLEMRGEKLWSIGAFDPPLLILGVRFGLSSVFSPVADITPHLPVRFLTFLGGDSDLRGFDWASLPRSGVGALSGATTSFEARLHKILFRRVDLFGFVDTGILGAAWFALRVPYLMSPGAGVRWESPVGVFRLYAAQRFALAEPSGEPPYDRAWRLGFTFGEEF